MGEEGAAVGAEGGDCDNCENRLCDRQQKDPLQEASVP
jgi:hypothetical protein